MHLNLKQTQRLLWRLITAPEGVPKALKKFPRLGLPINPGQKISPADRLDIYANMYFYRILDSLKKDFPVLLKILGEGGFHNLITSYLHRHPPSHYSLRYAGQGLPQFMKSYFLIKKMPYLSDLVRMEWALLESFDAYDSNLLTLKDLKKIPPKNWGLIRFKMVPSCSLLSFRWPVDQIRHRALLGRRIKGIKESRCHLLVWRKRFKVYFRRVEVVERRVWMGILRGRMFGDLCTSVARTRGEARAVPMITGIIHQWLDDELLADFLL